jgi:L-ascorbate metabolism protein UlaG (beta-lactamase superfamily)
MIRGVKFEHSTIISSFDSECVSRYYWFSFRALVLSFFWKLDKNSTLLTFYGRERYFAWIDKVSAKIITAFLSGDVFNQSMKPSIKRVLKTTMITLLAFVLVLALAAFLFMQQTSFGKDPEGARLERIKKSPNYVNGSFVNLTDTPVQSADASYFQMIWKFIFPGDQVAPKKRLPSVKRDLKGVPDEKPTITYFGHSSYLIQLGGKNVLMDPVFLERISPVQYLGTKRFQGTNAYQLSDMPSIDFVVLSHDHYDHMDYETLKQLANTPTQFIVPLGVGAHLEYWGVKSNQITELDWWESSRVMGDMHITATPARHFSGRGFTRDKSLWSSYVLQFGDYKIFLGGDSGYEKHFARIGEQFGPFDLAILECGQYNVWWPYIHMMPEETAQAGIDLGAKVVWPVHWGKFALAFHPWDEPILRISKKSEELRLRLTTPMIGEQIIIGKQYPNQNWWELELDTQE